MERAQSIGQEDEIKLEEESHRAASNGVTRREGETNISIILLTLMRNETSTNLDGIATFSQIFPATNPNKQCPERLRCKLFSGLVGKYVAKLYDSVRTNCQLS